MKASMSLSVVVLMSGLVAGAQTAATPAPAAARPTAPAPGSIASHAGWPAPNPADVKSVEAILAATYEAISGPPGQPRDWNRFKSLFVPDAKLIPVRALPGSPDASHPSTDATYMSVDDYVKRASGGMTTNGFYEHSVHNDIQQFGDIVQVFSTYESRHKADDPKPFARGINSFQLLKDGERYWVVNIYWEAERPDNPIPAKFLPATSAANPPAALNSNFYGSWVGQLEYRDFSSNKQVFLPTWLTLTPDPDGKRVKLSYIYDDGPTKTVRESSTLALVQETNKASLTSDRDKSSETYDVAGLMEFAKLGRGTLMLTGKGTENEKPVDVRITLSLLRNLYTFRKETRQPGEEFKFRDGYTFTRADVPSL